MKILHFLILIYFILKFLEFFSQLKILFNYEIRSPKILLNHYVLLVNLLSNLNLLYWCNNNLCFFFLYYFVRQGSFM